MVRAIQLYGAEILTQIGLKRSVSKRGFRCAPRSHEKAMSLLLGKWDVDWAVRTAFGRESTAQDSVRYSTAERLSSAGFQVIHDQEPYQAHVSVQFEGEWTEEVCEAFHASFLELEG